jgi:predicted nucleic acid-binding protein
VRYLLDTSAILEIASGSEKGRRVASSLKGEVLTCSVCAFEALDTSAAAYRKGILEFLGARTVLPFGLADSVAASELSQESRRAGRQVPPSDCMIAAVCRNNLCALATADSDFKRISGLEVALF